MKQDTFIKVTFASIVVYLLACLAAGVAIGAVAVHFIRKFW